MKIIRITAALLALMMLFGVCACGTTVKTEEPATAGTKESATEQNSEPASEPASTTEPADDKAYVFPENGKLRILTDGKAPGAIDGRNPSLAGENFDKILVFLDCTFRKAGLDLANDTQIAYSVNRADGSVLEGVSTLDTVTCDSIRNEYGYVGLCFDIGTTLDRYEKVTFTATFKDAAGKEYTLENKTLYKGLSYLGLSSDAFGTAFPDHEIEVGKNIVTMKKEVNDTPFIFRLDLGKWAGLTSPEQIIVCAQLFWECYPRMYARFGEAGKAPTNVTLAVENEGYGIAEAGGDRVHIHDNWLHENRDDFDCLTHEFAHLLQNGWDDRYCEFSDNIETFVDACRYLYAYQSGLYNDGHWSIGSPSRGETTPEIDLQQRKGSVRFFVWLDYFYSTPDNDMLLKFFTACCSRKYTSGNWAAAWAEIFAGTELEGKTVDEVWQLFKESTFAYLSTAGNKNRPSPLLKKYPDVRERVKP